VVTVRRGWLGRRRPTRKTVKALARGAALAVSIIVAFGIVARYTNLLDRLFIFFPERALFETPGDRGLSFEDVFFTTSDGVKLHGWFVPGRNELTLVWFHGNAGNIGHRVDNLAEMHRYLGVNIFIFDYRGYGRSEGSPTEAGTYLDAQGAVDYLRGRPSVDPNRLVLFGRSLGCAIAAEAASKSQPYALVLESPFTSVQAMAKRVYPFLPGAGRLVRTRYDCLSRVGSVGAPVMVLHGDQDSIVPYEMGREVYEAASPPKRFYRIEGADHNDTYLVGGAAYYEALAGFLEDPAGTQR
jgi:fermentation-respiration switch protein FrsA (DUF1100 family)